MGDPRALLGRDEMERAFECGRRTVRGCCGWEGKKAGERALTCILQRGRDGKLTGSRVRCIY